MIAFFDTNVYIDALKGNLSEDSFNHFFKDHVVRLCPVVYHELLRGLRTARVRKRVESAARNILFLPPPTVKMWIDAAKLIPKVIGNFDGLALAHLQNDVLIALTARETGTTLITRDSHFKRIREFLPFKFRLVL